MRYTFPMHRSRTAPVLKRHSPCRSRPRPWLAWLLGAALLAAGCASAPPVALGYDDLLASAPDGEVVDVVALKKAFLAAPNFAERFRELTRLETQALAMLDGRPLRLGAIGSAILDKYYGSLVGHLALARFYGDLEALEQAAVHDAWVAAIRAGVMGSAAGALLADPYRALSANEARAFLMAAGLTVVGSSYHESETQPLALWLTARSNGGRVQNVFFDLDDLYLAFQAAVARDATTLFPIPVPTSCANQPEMRAQCDDFSPSSFIHILARGGDAPAQTHVGLKLAAWNRYENAVPWLQQAAQAGNALASRTLANVALTLAQRATDGIRQRWLERVERQSLLAIAAGFDAAMVSLGRLYLRAEYGDEKIPAGLALLIRAAEVDNIDALLILGRLYAYGYRDAIAADSELSEQYFVRAAHQDEDAKLQYARFLLSDPDDNRAFNDRAWHWLREVAKNRNPQAMLLIGRLYHTGVHVNQSPRRAKSWFKNAVKAAPEDPNVVNEVAWTLTVTRMAKLRDERYALRIMDRVMADEDNAARRNPSYLDTWAAAHAANGDFERAILVQQQAIAIEQAKPNDQSSDSSDLDVFLKHLAAFRAGERISDDAVP